MKAILNFTNLDGTELSFDVDSAAILTIAKEDGKAVKFNAPKGTKTHVTDINEMDATQLKNEIRNAGSVLYKTAKRLKEVGKDTEPEAVAKIETMTERVETAKALMLSKFPAGAKQAKATKAQAILKAIKESNLPEDQKAAALAKLEDLVAVLNKAAASNVPAAEVAAEVVPEPVVEGEVAPVVEVESTDEVSRRRR